LPVDFSQHLWLIDLGACSARTVISSSHATQCDTDNYLWKGSGLMERLTAARNA